MTVRVEKDAGVVLVTLDRPARRNAVDHETLLELLEAQRSIREDSAHETRVVVLTGTPPAFCAGADLHGVEEGQFLIDLALVLRGFGTLSVPVIAAIDGPALGAGAQLVISADLRVATADSTFGIPAAKLGLVVDHWTVRRLATEFSPAVARAMLLAAETYSGTQLHAIGAVHRIGSLDDAIGWAHDVSALAPLSNVGHKVALERVTAEPEVDEIVEQARRSAWASEDISEGRAAFLEKRPPDFRGE